MSDYDRIAKAMLYIADHWSEKPSLATIASQVHLSPYHFQRLFCRWAGITPKRFQQVVTLEYGKHLLDETRSLLEVSESLGLSSSSRLHEHFVQLEAVTPGEYRRKGEGLSILYGIHATPFGEVFIAKTPRGICRLAFLDVEPLDDQLAALAHIWPLAQYTRDDGVADEIVAQLFRPGHRQRPLSLHVAGTNFQIAVWKALLRLPYGGVASYGQIAKHLDQPKAARAIGNAVGANPVALVIPCHRVIQQSGALGNYHWGKARKQAIQVWERAKLSPGDPRIVNAR